MFYIFCCFVFVFVFQCIMGVSELSICLLPVCVSSHLLVPQHHCRSSSPACARGCWRTERILGQRAQSQPAWKTKRRQKNRKERNLVPHKHSDWRGVSSGHAASPQMCQSQERHSPQAGVWKTKVIINLGDKRFLQSPAHSNQIRFTKWLVQTPRVELFQVLGSNDIKYEEALYNVESI